MGFLPMRSMKLRENNLFNGGTQKCYLIHAMNGKKTIGLNIFY